MAGVFYLRVNQGVKLLVDWPILAHLHARRGIYNNGKTEEIWFQPQKNWNTTDKIGSSQHPIRAQHNDQMCL